MEGGGDMYRPLRLPRACFSLSYIFRLISHEDIKVLIKERPLDYFVFLLIVFKNPLRLVSI